MRRVIACMIVAATATVWAGPSAIAGGGCHSEKATVAAGSEVTMKANCFWPAVLWVAPDTTVRFVNSDEVNHQVWGWPGSNLFADDLGHGAIYEATLSTTGVYSYACWLHPGMTGAIVVGAPTRPSGEAIIGPAGSSGAIRSAPPAAAPVAASRESGTVGGAAALAAAVAGTIGFVLGRRRREPA